MSGGLEILVPVASPLLERVAREERIGRDHPRRQRDGKPAQGERNAEAAAAADEETGDAGNSPTHIDLRV